MTHTAQDLLAAVGVDWKAKYARIFCPECSMNWNPETRPGIHHSTCRRPDTSNVEPTYTGPALHTDDLDRVLLSAAFAEARKPSSDYHGNIYSALEKIWPGHAETECYGPLDWLIFICPLPGHALAAAIAEVGG